MTSHISVPDTSENCDPNSSSPKSPQITENPIKPTDAVTESDITKVVANKETISDDPMIDKKDISQVEQVEFKVIFNKNKYDIVFGWDQTIKELKIHLENIIGVAQNAQKLLIKGMAKDEMTLRKAGVVKGGKVMAVGSKMNDILAVTNCKQQLLTEEKIAASSSTKEPLCEQKIHRKVLDKGIPPDVMAGIKGKKEPLPPVPLSGMLNKYGGKVRLTFKVEQDELWLGTKDRTDKLALTSIRGITSEPIKEHEQYHIMALQLGPTDASKYWVYWVPAQYIEAIKDAVLGKWQLF